MIVRLNKFIAECGVASRRGADKLISDGKVKVNGAVVTKLGVEINDKSDVVSVDGVVLKQAERKVYLMMNKPKGCVCTAQDEDKNRKTVYDYLETDVRVFSVGRLDYDSEGLLLFTNDGELANYLTHP
ncbi:MAG: pseudouridine synthase, partial [Faecalibacterium sp.]|nr:pseudouridine synthase [Faecalibacterium sp.]